MEVVTRQGSPRARRPRHLKVTQEQYFDAAVGHLAEHGPDGLTIGVLCRALGVTSGSFYHYFGSWDGFVEALLRHWEATQTGRIAALAAAQPDADARLDVLHREVVALPHDIEAAIRAWACSDATVRRTLARVDGRRRAELRASIAAAGVRAADADQLATMGVALLVGVQQLRPQIDDDAVRAVFDEFRRTIRHHCDQERRGTTFSGRVASAAPDEPSAP